MEKEYTVAVHEAGHAVMDFLFHVGVQFISIVPDEETLGRCIPNSSRRHDTLLERIEYGDATVRDLQYLFQTKIAGVVATELFCGQKWNLGGSDADGVLFALGGAGRCLIFEAFPPQDMERGFEALRDEWSNRMTEDARTKLRTHAAAVKAIADKLMQRKTVSGRLARKLFLECLPK
jgi:hypothetical protein